MSESPASPPASAPRARHAAPVPVDSPSRTADHPAPVFPRPEPAAPVPPPGADRAAATPGPGGGPGGPEPDPRRWKALAVCLVAVFMTLLDVSIVNVALPDIDRVLHATPADLQWVLSGYALAFGLILVPAGRLGDLRTRRSLFLISVAAFVIASALCGLSPNPTFLVIARLVQGLAAGALTPQVSGLIQELFRGPERGRAFGYFGAVIGLSTAIGPVLGGLLILAGGDTSGWRLVFYVNLPIGIVALFFAYRLLPRGGAQGAASAAGTAAPRLTSAAFDPVGTLLLALAVVAVLLPLVEDRQWTGSAKWLLLPVAAVLAVAFILWERRVGARGGAPAVDLSLFDKRTFAAGNLIGLIYFAGFTSVFFVTTLFLQQGHGYTAWQAGLASSPFAVGGLLTSRIAGKRAGASAGRLIQVGSMMFSVGFAAAVLILRHHSGGDIGFWLALPLLVSGLGNGLVLAANQTSTLSEVPVRQAGVAGALFQTSLRVGTAIGIAVVASAFYNELASSRGDYSRALQRGYAIAILFGAVSFVAALLVGRRGRPSTITTPAPGATPAEG